MNQSFRFGEEKTNRFRAVPWTCNNEKERTFLYKYLNVLYGSGFLWKQRV
jgi:hypothetical protein